MRIIAGKFRGRLILPPIDKRTRPLKDRAKEGIFNILIHSKKLNINFDKTHILDLYCGTGSFGLECLSRGAKSVTFVENNLNAKRILEQNIEKLSVDKLTKIYFQNVENFLLESKKIKKKINLTFFDPPFKDKNIKLMLDLIKKNELLESKNTLIMHRHKDIKEKYPYYFKISEQKNYGNSKIIFGSIIL